MYGCIYVPACIRLHVEVFVSVCACVWLVCICVCFSFRDNCSEIAASEYEQSQTLMELVRGRWSGGLLLLLIKLLTQETLHNSVLTYFQEKAFSFRILTWCLSFWKTTIDSKDSVAQKYIRYQMANSTDVQPLTLKNVEGEREWENYFFTINVTHETSKFHGLM